MDHNIYHGGQKNFGRCGKTLRIIIRFWQTAHLPLPLANIKTYFSLTAKCWLRGGVGSLYVSGKLSTTPPLSQH